MPQAKLIITHGLPGSGKSTWAEEEVARIRAEGGNAVRVNRDDIREHLFGEEYLTKKPEKDKEQQVNAVEEHLTNDFLSKGYIVIKDNTNLNANFLSEHRRKAKEHGAELEQEYFDIPVEECQRRNKARGDAGGRFVPPHAISRMASKAYGRDGRLKEFRIGEKAAYAYDRAGVKGEDEIAAYEKRQQQKLGKPQGGVLFLDMDGSAVDVREIADKYMSDPKRRDYKSFHLASEFSPANEDVIKIIREAESNNIPIVVTTARSSDYVEPTVNWLEKHDVPAVKLFMRKSGDGRKDYEVKPEFIKEAAEEGMFPLFAVEDNPGAIQGWKEHGVPVVEVPYYSALPLESTEEADAASKHSEAAEKLSGEDLSTPESPRTADEEIMYPKIEVASPFRAGWCVRCGSKLKDPSKTIGDKCRTKA